LIARDLLGKPDAIEFVPVVSANRFQYLNTEQGRLPVLDGDRHRTAQEVVDFSAIRT
jgi:hypothetical protein